LNKNSDGRTIRATKVVVAVAALVLLAILASAALVQQTRSSSNRNPDVFTPAHSSIYEATRHFFGIRPEPEQPLGFVHKVHVEKVELTCLDCHITAARGPAASLPDIRTCWSCHEKTLVDHPEIVKMKKLRDAGQDIPWARVYGWNEESHVRFNHAPHIRSKVECATCHGSVEQMTVATRAVDHTMSFCVTCHQQRQASTDCQACHY
jgi:hypothetical protein